MSEETMKKRTKQFALRTIQLCESLPETRTGRVIANQLLRSGTSVGANYRAACRARSSPDFVSKIGITLEESDESAYWMELIVEANLIPESRVSNLLQEADELTAIFNASHKTANLNLREVNRKSKIENRK
ncbi:MAG: four helix bundle protein [Chloroflexota bacterium]|nr:MAG: four helix bundle protein [Chloroflexota bacterium]